MSHSIYTNLIEQLIPNLPEHKGEPIELDLVLDNGAFNGLYLLGILSVSYTHLTLPTICSV